MTELFEQLKDLVLLLLDTDQYKTAAHLAEELRGEYPAFYRTITETYAHTYQLSGCGAQMSPVTLVLQTLNDLYREDYLRKKQANGIIFWQRK
jgi:hypothetical protein